MQHQRASDSQFGAFQWIDKKVPVSWLVTSLFTGIVFMSTIWFGMIGVKESLLSIKAEVVDARNESKALLVEMTRMNVANASTTAGTTQQLRDHERRITFIEAQMQKVRSP